jgi:hypothetical protein
MMDDLASLDEPPLTNEELNEEIHAARAERRAKRASVLDTNTAVSGLLWSDPPSQVIDAVIVGTVSLFTSAVLSMRERDVLQRPKLARRLALRGLTAPELLAEYAKLTVVVSPTPLRAAGPRRRYHTGRACAPAVVRPARSATPAAR